MDKHLIILALALVLALTVALSLFWYTAAAAASVLPQFKEPPVSCALPQPQFAEYGCTVQQTMPGYHPAEEASDVTPVFLPVYPGSNLCRAYYVDGLHNGTLTFCPVHDIDRHD
jgi:hypothetical protein